MIQLANLYKQEVQDGFRRSLTDPRCQHLNTTAGGWSNVEIDFAPSTWNLLQVVSVGSCPDQPLGYLQATLDRAVGIVTEVMALRFTAKPDKTWSADMRTFLRSLLTDHGFRKVRWSALAENPACQVWDRLAAELGGGRVALYREEVKRGHGWADLVVWEVRAQPF